MKLLRLCGARARVAGVSMVLSSILTGMALSGHVLANADTPVGIPDDQNKFLSFINKNSPLYQENDATAAAYYQAVDPTNARTTLADFKAATGLNAGNDALAVYINNADLGFGRRMYTKTNPDGSVTSCVENYGGSGANVGKIDPPVTDQEKLDNAKLQTNLIATVCMDWSGTPGSVTRGDVIAENDNISSTNLNSRLKLRLTPGTYNFVAASRYENFTGSYAINIVNGSNKTLLSASGTWVYPDTVSGGLNPFAKNNPSYTLVLTSTQTLTINLTGSGIDPYLYVLKKTVTPNIELTGHRYTKFFVYGSDGKRVGKADLDGRGAKFVPGVCNVCHGGVPRQLENNVYPKLGDTNAQFLPWDVDTLVFDTTDPAYSRAAQEPAFKIFNKSVLATYPAPQTRSFVGNVAIPDGNSTGVYIPLTVSGIKGSINQLIVSIDATATGVPGIQHTNASDLYVELISPNGRVANVFNSTRNNWADVKNAYFTDDAEELFSIDITRPDISAPAPYTGNWIPYYGTSYAKQFNDENPNGVWQLHVIDGLAGNTGSVNAWSLHFNGVPDAVRIPAPVELIRGWYGGAGLPSATFNGSFVPTGWLPPNAPAGASEVYSKVIAPTCRACHAQRGLLARNEIDFASYNKFALYAPKIESLVYDKGVMPLARRTYQTHFWAKNAALGGLSQADILANYLPNFSHRAANGTVLTPGRPIANAGVSRTGIYDVPTNHAITLNGKASQFATSFAWSVLSKPAGSYVTTLTNWTSPTPSFTPDVDGNYIFSLVVKNAAGVASAPSTVTITASSVSLAPISFNSDIWGAGSGGLGILRRTCGGCHTGVNPNMPQFKAPLYGIPAVADRDFSYNSMIERINFDDVADSLVLRKNLGEPHGGGAILNDPYYGTSQGFNKKIWRWILEGGQNN